MLVELSAGSALVEVRGRWPKAKVAMIRRTANAHIDRSVLFMVSEAESFKGRCPCLEQLPDKTDLSAPRFRQLIVGERVSGSSENSFDEGINESFLHVSEDRRTFALVTGKRMIVQ